MDFVLSKHLGSNKEGIIVFHVPDDHMRKLYSLLRNKFSEIPRVLGVSASRDLFDGQQGIIDADEVGSSEDSHIINMFRMYPNFVETMGIELVAGRTFTEPLTDSTSFIVNEAAVKIFGWGNDDAIGKKLSGLHSNRRSYRCGERFSFLKPHTQIAPLIMLVPKSKIEYLYVRVAPGMRIKRSPLLNQPGR